MTENAHKAMKNWLQVYRVSVGKPADECLDVFRQLATGKLAEGNNLSLLHELLTIMSDLSPDPHTVSCAMLFVAMESGEDLQTVCTDVSKPVCEQLARAKAISLGSSVRTTCFTLCELMR